MERRELEYTRHARESIEEREYPLEWIESTVASPNSRLLDADDPTVEIFLRPIPEFGNRVLRVVVNTYVSPWRVVSVYFDRRMRGAL